MTKSSQSKRVRRPSIFIVANADNVTSVDNTVCYATVKLMGDNLCKIIKAAARLSFALISLQFPRQQAPLQTRNQIKLLLVRLY